MGIVLRLIAEILDAWGIRGKPLDWHLTDVPFLPIIISILICGEAAHGRPPAVASGIKEFIPTMSYLPIRGDGDLAAIGDSRDYPCCQQRREYYLYFRQ